jgi:hypothetical protein
MNRGALLFSSLLCLASVAACETDLVDDPGFQLWCGERLCAWDLEEGEIRKVPTWHTHDYGVDLVGAPVLLSQGAQGGASCVRIEVTSKIESGAMVTVEVDEDGDGEVDWRVPVDSSERFVSQVRDVTLDLSYEGVFYLRKSGQGEAVVARLRVSEECGL